MAPRLMGEIAPAWERVGSRLPWKKGGYSPAPRKRPTWWRIHFRAPRDEQGISLDFSGLGKGVAWVNGQCIGRYWLLPTLKNAEGRPSETPETPTQRYYKVPAAWLANAGEPNSLVLFDEEGASPARIRVCRHILKPASRPL
jgi:beta-galactosidase